VQQKTGGEAGRGAGPGAALELHFARQRPLPAEHFSMQLTGFSPASQEAMHLFSPSSHLSLHDCAAAEFPVAAIAARKRGIRQARTVHPFRKNSSAPGTGAPRRASWLRALNTRLRVR